MKYETEIKLPRTGNIREEKEKYIKILIDKLRKNKQEEKNTGYTLRR